MQLQRNIDDDFVRSIAELTHPVAVVHDIYRQKALVIGSDHTVFDDPSLPTPKPLQVASLQGVVDLVSVVPADPDGQALAVHIISPTRVDIVRPFTGSQVQNLVYGVAEPKLPTPLFDWYQDPETFLIWLMTGFVETDHRIAVQKACGSFKSGLVAEIEDDGVSQTAATKAGLTRTAQTKIENPVFLAPFRTFPEVSQPESAFILRAKQVQQGDAIGAQAALFEADGGRWRMLAMDSIREWLSDRLAAAGVTILG